MYAVIGAWQLTSFLVHGGTWALIVASLTLLAAVVQLLQTVRKFKAQKATQNEP